ncbi:MAG: T9SS type A sorting domain-containing protein [bacterium]|nr:T9SS type A sorting domain-containing protein [bacterium]
MTRSHLRNAVAAILLLVGCVAIHAQTNPTTFALTSGSYTFTQWDNTNTAGTYPANMRFHAHTPSVDPDITLASAASSDWDCAYNVASGSRVIGKGAGGFSFINTGSSLCGNKRLGSAVLALNSTGRTTINVAWTGATVVASTRVYAIRLQYRVGTSGSWLDVLDGANNPVEYLGSTTGNSASFSNTLPAAAENQLVVQVRWIYYYISGAGGRPEMSVDEITVSSLSGTGTPTKFGFGQITPTTPSASSQFSVQVRAVDASNNPQNVTLATSFNLSLVTGTGTLSGNLSGTIPAGANSVTVTGVRYNTAQSGVVIRATRTAGDNLAFGDSNPFTVAPGGTQFLVQNFENVGYTNTPFLPFNAIVLRADGTTDVNYIDPVTITKLSGPGNLVFTTSATPINGNALFNNVSVDAPGTYVLQLSAPNIGTYTLPAITVYPAPVLNTQIVPQYLSSRVSSSLGFPIPTYSLVTFTNLQPGTTYRFISGVATDQVLTSTGGAFNVHYDGPAHNYFYTASKSLTNAASYSMFSTQVGETSKSVWVNLVQTSNVAFDEGSTIYWRVSLADNIGRFIKHYELSLTSKVLRLGPEPLTTRGTGIADVASQSTPKNVILLYDNTAGTGRPLSSAIVQNDGATVPGSETFYGALENTTGAWATIIPNVLPTGVRRIEERDGRNGNIVYSITSADGIWNGVNTVNPAGGYLLPIYLQTPRITIQSPVLGDTLCAGALDTILFTARGTQNVRIELSTTGGTNWMLLADVPASSGQLIWNAPSSEYNPNLRIRITGIERPDISASTGNFVVSAPLAVIQQPASADLCVGDNHQFVVLTEGTIRRVRWFKDDREIIGATGSIFRITNAQYPTSGVFYAIVEGVGGCGDIRTENVTLRVARPTQIAYLSRAVPTRIGDTAVLTVEAEVPGDAARYQWYRGTTPLVESAKFQGTQSTRLEIRGVEATDIGNDYRVVVVGVCGTATSRVVSVFSAGVFIEFTENDLGVCAGQTAMIDANIYTNPGGAPFNVRWFFNGQQLSDGSVYTGTSSTTLTIQNVNAAVAGAYTVRATLTDDETQFGEGTAVITLSSAPTINTQPTDVRICEGQPFTLSVTAAAQGPIKYQWHKGTTALPGETGPSFTIANAGEAREGMYTVVVTTPCGNVMSVPVAVIVDSVTTITEQPISARTLTINQSLTLTVAARGTGTLQYQWFKDGVEITGVVTPSYVIVAANTTDAGRYWVRVRSSCGDVFSDTTTITVNSTVSVSETMLSNGSVVSTIRPNPTMSVATFTLTLNAPQNVTIRIVNAAGVVVATVMNQSNVIGTLHADIDAAGLPNGMYYVVTQIGNERHQQALAVIK